jgi:hypothetical protein
MISHELTISRLHESDRGIDLVSDISTVCAIFCHLDYLIETTASLLQTRDDVFAIVLHNYYPTIGYGYKYMDRKIKANKKKKSSREVRIE